MIEYNILTIKIYLLLRPREKYNDFSGNYMWNKKNILRCKILFSQNVFKANIHCRNLQLIKWTINLIKILMIHSCKYQNANFAKR